MVPMGLQKWPVEHGQLETHVLYLGWYRLKFLKARLYSCFSITSWGSEELAILGETTTAQRLGWKEEAMGSWMKRHTTRRTNRAARTGKLHPFP